MLKTAFAIAVGMCVAQEYPNLPRIQNVAKHAWRDFQNKLDNYGKDEEEGKNTSHPPPYVSPYPPAQRK